MKNKILLLLSILVLLFSANAQEQQAFNQPSADRLPDQSVSLDLGVQ